MRRLVEVRDEQGRLSGIGLVDPDLFIPAPWPTVHWRRRPVIRYERELMCFNVEGEVDSFFVMDDFGNAVPALEVFGILNESAPGFYHG